MKTTTPVETRSMRVRNKQLVHQFLRLPALRSLTQDRGSRLLTYSSAQSSQPSQPILNKQAPVHLGPSSQDEMRSIPQQHDQQFSPSPNQGQGYQGQAQHVSQNPGQYGQGFQGASFPSNPQQGQFTDQPQYMGQNFENREGMQLPQESFGAYPDPPMQVDAPYSVSWDHTHVNTVKVIGVVGQPPRVRYKGQGTSVVASVRLGVKTPRAQNSSPLNWMDVEFWGTQALQIERYIQKGMQLAVGGSLKQDTWMDATTQRQRSQLVLNADYFQVVKSNFDRAGPRPSSNRTQQPTTRPSESDIAIYNLWQTSPEATWLDVVNHENTTAKKVLDQIGFALTSDQIQLTESDAVRLALQLEISADDSPYITFDALSLAWDQALEDEKSRGGTKDLQDVRLKAVYEKLRANTEPRPNNFPVPAQIVDSHQALYEGLGTSLTYGQIRFVKAMKMRGLNLSPLLQGQMPLDVRAALESLPQIQPQASALPPPGNYPPQFMPPPQYPNVQEAPY